MNNIKSIIIIIKITTKIRIIIKHQSKIIWRVVNKIFLNEKYWINMLTNLYNNKIINKNITPQLLKIKTQKQT